MPRNLKGGKSAKKKSNKKENFQRKKDNIPLPLNEENSHVARVLNVLGDRRFNVKIISDNGLKNEEMISHLGRGAAKSQGRVIVDSIIKISKRDFENKSDILYRYNPSEVDYLVKSGIMSQDDNKIENDDIEFTLDNDEELDISDI